MCVGNPRNTLMQVSLEEMCGAFWDTEGGRAMRDQLDNHPFDKCARMNSYNKRTVAGIDAHSVGQERAEMSVAKCFRSVANAGI